MSKGNDRWLEGLRVGAENERARIREGAVERAKVAYCTIAIARPTPDQIAACIVDAVLGVKP